MLLPQPEVPTSETNSFSASVEVDAVERRDAAAAPSPKRLLETRDARAWAAVTARASA